MEKESRKKVSYQEVKSSGQTYDPNKIILLNKLFQHLYYAKLRKQEVKKVDYLFKFGKNKKVAEKVWECFYDLQIEWPYEMYGRIFDLEE